MSIAISSSHLSISLGAYRKALERSNMKLYKSSSIEETPYKEHPVPFYNWINERGRRSELLIRPNLENWLEW